MKNLKDYGVQDLNAKELRETNGGLVGLDGIINLVTGIIGTVVSLVTGLLGGLLGGI
ncbi:hypothetical protein [Sinomicrobium sp. M5D2P17]